MSSGKKTIAKWLYNREGYTHFEQKQSSFQVGFSISSVVYRIVVINPFLKIEGYLNRFKGLDGILFVWDSLIDSWIDNIAALKELLKIKGEYISGIDETSDPETPLVLLANKRDLDDIIEISKIRKVLETANLSHCLSYEIIAITGVNVKRAVVYVTRQAVLNHYKRLQSYPGEYRPRLFDSVIPSLETLLKIDDLKGTFVVFKGKKFEVKGLELTINNENIEKMSDIEGLEDLSNITLLDLSNNEIQEIGDLSNLSKLNTLYLTNNKIKKIENLDKIPGLISLKLSNNQISEIEGLESVPKLKYLELSHNKIKEIKGLDNNRDLELLNMVENPIKEIKNLSKLEKLKFLYIGNEELEDLINLLGGVNEKGRVNDFNKFYRYYRESGFKMGIDILRSSKLKFARKKEAILKELNVFNLTKARQLIDELKEPIKEGRGPPTSYKTQVDELYYEVEKDLILSQVWGRYALPVNRVIKQLDDKYKIKKNTEEIILFIDSECENYSVGIDPIINPEDIDQCSTIVPWDQIIFFINSILNDIAEHQSGLIPTKEIRNALFFPDHSYIGIAKEHKMKLKFINILLECKDNDYFIRDVNIDDSFIRVLPEINLAEKIDNLHRRTEVVFQSYVNQLVPEIIDEINKIKHDLEEELLFLIHLNRDKVLPDLTEIHRVSKDGWEQYKELNSKWSTIWNKFKTKLHLQNSLIFVFKCHTCGNEHQFIYFQETRFSKILKSQKLSTILKSFIKIGTWTNILLDLVETGGGDDPVLILKKDEYGLKKEIPTLLPEEIMFLYKTLIGLDKRAKTLDKTFFIKTENGKLIHSCLSCNPNSA